MISRFMGRGRCRKWHFHNCCGKRKAKNTVEQRPAACGVCRKGPQESMFIWGKRVIKMRWIQSKVSLPKPYKVGSGHLCRSGPVLPEGCYTRLCEVRPAFFLFLFLNMGSSRVYSQEGEWLFSNRYLYLQVPTQCR